MSIFSRFSLLSQRFRNNVAPLIWFIPINSTTSVGFAISVQSRIRATSGAVRAKRLSTSGSQQVNERLFVVEAQLYSLITKIGQVYFYTVKYA